MLSGRNALARASLRVMILELALVFAQLHFHVDERLVECPVSVRTFTFRLQNRTRIQVQAAVGTVKRTIVGEYHIGFRAAVEMFAHDLFQTASYARRERFANLNLLS